MSDAETTLWASLGSEGPKFEKFHRRTQIKRLRELAGVALATYDLPPSRLTLVAHFFNTTFRVDTSTGERFVLRINRAGRPTVERVGTELNWLAAIRRDTTLEVPSPQPTRQGSLLTIASTDEIPWGYICVLFRWLPGRLLKQGFTPRHMRRVGALLGHLQNHAAQWRVQGGNYPLSSARSRVDIPMEAARGLPDPFAPEFIAQTALLVTQALSEEEAALVKEVLLRVSDAEKALGQGPDTFGLIHADLHYWNVLFSGDKVRAIDFDDCGFGPLLYDFVPMLSAIQCWPDALVLRTALLAGYREVRPLSSEHESCINIFIALRRIQDALWDLNPSALPALDETWQKEARLSLALIAAVLDDN